MHLCDGIERGVGGAGSGGLRRPLEGILGGLLHVALAPGRVAARARGSRHAGACRRPRACCAAGRLHGSRLGPPCPCARGADRCCDRRRAACCGCLAAVRGLAWHACTPPHRIRIAGGGMCSNESIPSLQMLSKLSRIKTIA